MADSRSISPAGMTHRTVMCTGGTQKIILVSEDDFDQRILTEYRTLRRGTMRHLKLYWERGRVLQKIKVAAKAKGWTLNDCLARLHAKHGIRWSREVVYSYIRLSREPWDWVAQFGSKNKAMEAIRAKRKSPQEKQRELQKRTRSQLKAEIVRLKQELQQKDEKIAQLELKLFSPTPSLKRGDNRSWR